MTLSTASCGKTSGTGVTTSGPGTSTHLLFLKHVTFYSDTNYIYGAELKWNDGMGGTITYDYANTSSGTANSLNLFPMSTNDYVCYMGYYLESGYLSGLAMSTLDSQTLYVGYAGSYTTLFGSSGGSDEWTDLVTYSGTIPNVTPAVTFGIEVYYDPPTHKIPHGHGHGNVNGDCSANSCCNCQCGGCTCVCTVL